MKILTQKTRWNPKILCIPRPSQGQSHVDAEEDHQQGLDHGHDQLKGLRPFVADGILRRGGHGLGGVMTMWTKTF